ncbi:MAG: putative DNA-binding domain-containing protein [Lutibacter sp.]|uniref:HvfC/BufC family peptide modification chaperone n=1 Tax=Lutibacter sp. TaxID=1925666 RepID=UPI00299F010C|nr:putative DNA-binding domain-containing protein [Lutibacter sp.]MDX1828345.1 putative DNA-binding domain-containing protein [Lutibacter sp.]
MQLLPKTFQYQTDLANYCKTGDYISIPGVNEKNIKHYRRLVFNNVYDSITSAYPITKKLFGKKKWKKVVNRFFSSQKIQSSQIWYMPKEFKDYVISHENKLLNKYAFLADLLQFEWLEIEVFMMPDEIIEYLTETNLYYINPEIRLIKTTYPIHLKKAKNITEEDKGNYFISLHRNKETGAVEFTNLSIPFVDVLENLMEKPLTENAILNILQKYVELTTAKSAFHQFEQIAITNQLLFKK